MAELSREKFVDRVIEHVHVKFPLVKIARAEQSFSVRVNGHVASLENIYRMTVLKPEDLDYHVDRWMVELLRVAEGRPDQLGAFEEVRDRVLPMVLSNRPQDPSIQGVVSQPLLEMLSIAYAIDADRTISYIPQARFEQWNVSIEDLHEVAIENLVARSQSIGAHAAQDEDGEVNLILFQTMDGYDSSRILLPTLHERLREFLGSPFVAAIPNRDILLCFRNDDETRSRLKEQIREDYRQMPHQVTDRLLLVTPDGLAPAE